MCDCDDIYFSCSPWWKVATVKNYTIVTIKFAKGSNEMPTSHFKYIPKKFTSIANDASD